jgi:AraC-like DNA-binding protein
MSSRSRPIIKQKRLRQPYRIVYVPVLLPKDFPLREDSFFAQGDAPITYLHGHDCLEIGYCHEGAGVFVIGDKVLPFQAGAVSVVTPAEFHLARSLPGTRSKWSWLYLDPIRLLRASPPEIDFLRSDSLAGKSFGNIITPHIDPLAGVLVRQIVEECRSRPRGYRPAIKGLVWSLMVRFNRLAPARVRPGGGDLRDSLQRVAPALDLMAARYADPLSTRDWAHRCHLSPTHFRRRFRQALGQSPHQYLTRLRVRMAAARLQAADEKIVTIAGEAGFATQSSFNRAFRLVMKCTPRAWRRQR